MFCFSIFLAVCKHMWPSGPFVCLNIRLSHTSPIIIKTINLYYFKVQALQNEEGCYSNCCSTLNCGLFRAIFSCGVLECTRSPYTLYPMPLPSAEGTWVRQQPPASIRRPFPTHDLTEQTPMNAHPLEHPRDPKSRVPSGA